MGGQKEKRLETLENLPAFVPEISVFFFYSQMLLQVYLVESHYRACVVIHNIDKQHLE